MRLVEYTPSSFEALSAAAARMQQPSSMLHRPFVDYYYATRDWSKLYLLLDPQEQVVGTIGVELARFLYNSQELIIGVASNFHALQHGAGGYLFMKWMKSCPLGMIFGGSPDTHRIIQQQKWTYFPGIRAYFLNRRYSSYAGESGWRPLAKSVLRKFLWKRIPEYASVLDPEVVRGLTVREERGCSEDMLPKQSPFSFRLALALQHLNWRYATDLPFVRYRVFRILRQGASAGYVILNDRPEQLAVSHCDGENPAIVAGGVLLSMLEAARDDLKPRAAMLCSSHPQMQAIYTRFGLEAAPEERPFALGSLRQKMTLSLDTSNWLVNFDWADNGLRAPFLDEQKGYGEAPS